MAALLTLEILFFGLTLWLGAYLISRDAKNMRLWLAGLGLFAYALLEASFILSTYPAPSTHPLNLGLIGWTCLRLLIGCMLLPPGLLVARVDAREQGEVLLPHILRAFDYSFFTALLFGGQVTLVIILVTGPTFPMLLLLLATVTASILAQVFSNSVVTWLDKIAFATFPQLQQARAELHSTADTLPRINQDLVLDALDESEFIRLTRRALSHFGDLSRLAANPLTKLPAVRTRLLTHNGRDDVLERATELKALLTESVVRLKPRDKGDFGTSDEWRYYNALYFPYIVGLKPYSSRVQQSPSDPVLKEALAWFRNQVPERTLYNWQSAATKLVAQDLRGGTTTLVPEASPTLNKKTRTSSRA